MKNLILVSTISLLSFNTFASAKNVQCKVLLTDNTVKCALGMFCKHKVLKESSMTINEEIEDGQIINGEISLHKVVVSPGTSEQKKFNVFLLEGDDRATKLQEKEDVDLVQFSTEEAIRYNIQRTNNTLNIEFKGSSNSAYKFNISGDYNEALTGWVYARLSGNEDFSEKLQPLLISCRQVSTNAIKQTDLEKKAIQEHLEKKKNKEQTSAQ